jgi:hypothetical protein
LPGLGGLGGALAGRDVMLDGEAVVVDAEGRLD